MKELMLGWAQNFKNKISIRDYILTGIEIPAMI